jgi:hypothetical protein
VAGLRRISSGEKLPTALLLPPPTPSCGLRVDMK